MEQKALFIIIRRLSSSLHSVNETIWKSNFCKLESCFLSYPHPFILLFWFPFLYIVRHTHKLISSYIKPPHSHFAEYTFLTFVSSNFILWIPQSLTLTLVALCILINSAWSHQIIWCLLKFLSSQFLSPFTFYPRGSHGLPPIHPLHCQSVTPSQSQWVSQNYSDWHCLSYKSNQCYITMWTFIAHILLKFIYFYNYIIHGRHSAFTCIESCCHVT